jgi:hypothetical protein
MSTIERRALAAAKSTHPPTSILNQAFQYTPAAQHANDPDYLRRKFAAIRAQQAAPNVTPITGTSGPRRSIAAEAKRR